MVIAEVVDVCIGWLLVFRNRREQLITPRLVNKIYGKRVRVCYAFYVVLARTPNEWSHWEAYKLYYYFIVVLKLTQYSHCCRLDSSYSIIFIHSTPSFRVMLKRYQLLLTAFHGWRKKKKKGRGEKLNAIVSFVAVISISIQKSMLYLLYVILSAIWRHCDLYLILFNN